ncbi:MAG: hypothetical protein AABZ31_11220 [Bdellovibrionota bacterium]
MPRELNPELFGTRQKPATPLQPQGYQAPEMHAGATSLPSLTMSPSHMYETPEAVKRKIRDLENQVQVLQQKIEKLSASFDQRMTQTQSTQKSIEMSLKSSLQEMAQNQANTISKMNERRVADAKIQEMVDRHNSLVQNFEIRMAAMHKVSSEQEMKLMTYQATIDEILREIRR